ncbi:phage tail protein [Neisseria weaveri]|uniref:phage tail protein n=1 Tax=Neisseria weaveri TaxID=28091 RepID=UPI0002231A1D|nr:phage tail protein [Neisseria weaveri]EGV38475.1 putative tail fiber protein [Neisseria weaveri ATCC 51223]
MHAIDTPDKQFKDGNGTSELGTILPAWWLNQVQGEILAVLTAAGIQPNKAKTNQLAEAINRLFVGQAGDQDVAGEKTFTSLLTAGRAEHWGKIRMPVQGGGHWFLEANPQSVFSDGSTLKFNIKYEQTSGQVRYIHFPELGNLNRTVAYQDWVIARIAGVESSAVKTTGNQTVGGKKTFSESADFARGLRISGSGQDQWFQLGFSTVVAFLKNPVSNKELRLGNDGVLSYQGDKILLWSDRRDAVDLANSQTVATSQAVKTVNDKAEQAAPPGTIVAYSGTTAPPGWLKCNGANVSRATYAALFAVIGTTHGAGDGRTTFTLPDIRNEFIRGLDDGRGLDSSRALGSKQTARLPQHSHGVGFMIGDDMRFAKAGANYNIDSGKDFYLSAGANSTTSVERYSGNGQRVETIATYGMTGDLAPSNIAELYIIKI